MDKALIKEIVIKEESFFYVMYNFIREGVYTFQMENIPNDKIQIYIPEYMLKMWLFWISERYRDFSLRENDFRFMGVKISDNWDKKVVVSFENIHYHSRLKPLILEIS